MKSDMRRILAQNSFEEKIRKVGELIRLSRSVTASRVNEEPDTNLTRFYPQSEIRNPK